MAISHVQPLHLLLASLFFLPTLLATDFYDCGFGELPVVATNVEAFQKKGAPSFYISCSTSKNIRDGFVTLEFKVGGELVMFRRVFKICELVACPVAPGAFELPIDTGSPVEVKDYYNAYVSIRSNAETMMCLVFSLDSMKTLPRSLLSQVAE